MNNDRIELLILQNLIYNEKYTRKVIPYLKDYHFQNPAEQEIFGAIYNIVIKYNSIPTRQTVWIDIKRKKKSRSLTEEIFGDCKRIVQKLRRKDDEGEIDFRWLVDATEDFVQDREIDNALEKSIMIREDPKLKNNRNEIVTILREAIATSFDANIGHDYVNDHAERIDHYHKKEEKTPCDIDLLNRAMMGGPSKGTLNIVIAGTGVGKTLALSHLTTSYFNQGKKILYITLEMSRFEIARRIDSNILDIDMNKIREMEKKDFVRKIADLRSKSGGQLIVKQYPTASASVMHFKHLIDELNLKKKFSPDIVMIDYLNICQSSRIKASSNAGMFTYAKAIAEEFRGLAVEVDVPIWTATQLNREGAKSKDVELTDTSESFGVPYTCDFMFALMATKDVKRLTTKILKNRYNDIHDINRFVIGVDRKKQRLFNIDEQTDFKNSDTDEEDQDVSVVRRKATKNGINKSIKNFRNRAYTM